MSGRDSGQAQVCSMLQSTMMIQRAAGTTEKGMVVAEEEEGVAQRAAASERSEGTLAPLGPLQDENADRGGRK